MMGRSGGVMTGPVQSRPHWRYSLPGETAGQWVRSNGTPPLKNYPTLRKSESLFAKSVMEKLRFAIFWAIALGALNAVAMGQAPADAPPEVPLVAEEPKILDKDARLTFSFRYQPWQEVLDWFADQAGLSLVFETLPPGTFNYNDTRTYSPAEALDVLNSVLLIKGYTLVRKDRMLVVVNLEDPIPPNLVPDISLEELDERGEYELVRVLFPVWNMTPDQAGQEIQ